jgi:hypothetical protein
MPRNQECALISAAPSSPSPLRGPFRPPILLDQGLLLSAVMMLLGRLVEAVAMLPSLSSGSHSRLARKSVQALLNLGLVGKRSDSRQFRLVGTISISTRYWQDGSTILTFSAESGVEIPKRREGTRKDTRRLNRDNQGLPIKSHRGKTCSPIHPRLHQSQVNPYPRPRMTSMEGGQE